MQSKNYIHMRPLKLFHEGGGGKMDMLLLCKPTRMGVCCGTKYLTPWKPRPLIYGVPSFSKIRKVHALLQKSTCTITKTV